MPYAVRHEALGLSIDGSKDTPQIGPKMESRDKYIKKSEDLLTRIRNFVTDSGPLPFKFLESFIGLHGFLCSFVIEGNARRNGARSVLKQQVNVRHDIRIIRKSDQFIKDVIWMREQIKIHRFLPLLKSPMAIHSGKVFCAGDAAMSADRKTGGFGGIAGDLYFMGSLPEEFRPAIKAKLISIHSESIKVLISCKKLRSLFCCLPKNTSTKFS